MSDADSSPVRPIDWEAFYGSYRKPGYVPGFEIVNKLGAGVFGIVFKARKESIGKDYAIKFLKVDDEAVRDAVLRELDSVRYFAQVDHPNLVSIEDKGEVDGIPYIVMAYAGATTLRDRIDEGPLDRDTALRLFVQVARGVQALHDRSLVHFDLKPANIYLKGDVARVGDYGLSKLVSGSRNSLSFGRGTPYYMAPEMLKRRGDHRSDIYSLGILLYEMLTGKPPFRGDSEWEVLRRHERDPVEFPPSVAPNEQRVLARCLAKDPQDRYESVQALLTDLVTAVPPAAPSSLTRPAAAPTPPRRVAPPGHVRRSGFPTISARKFFTFAVVCCVGVGLFVTFTVWSIAPHSPIPVADGPRRTRSVVESWSPPAPTVPADPDSPDPQQLRIGELIDLASGVEQDAAAMAELMALGQTVVPRLVNRLAKLDLAVLDDATRAARLDEILRGITGYSSGFAGWFETNEQAARLARENSRAVKRWVEWMRDRYRER